MPHSANYLPDNLLYDFLEEKVVKYNQHSFIETDPISIPHLFSKKQDIEIAGFLSAVIAWGNRKMIVKNARNMLLMMDDAPYDFVCNHSESDLKRLLAFKHRTFNGVDFIQFVKSLKYIYENHVSLETALLQYPNDLAKSISNFKEIFIQNFNESRSVKHLSNPLKNSAAKRINMFLRWMVRKDNAGVDFGIWRKIKPSDLHIPLDVHSGNTARKLGLLDRKQNDWKSVEQLTQRLKQFDSADPVKYDFALFGLGVFEKF